LKRLTILFFAALIVLLSVLPDYDQVPVEKTTFSSQQSPFFALQQDIFPGITGNHYMLDCVTGVTASALTEYLVRNSLQQELFAVVTINAP
jgi:hypothetical protein